MDELKNVHIKVVKKTPDRYIAPCSIRGRAKQRKDTAKSNVELRCMTLNTSNAIKMWPMPASRRLLLLLS